MQSADVSALICRRLRAARAPQLRSIVPIGAPKARQLEKRFHRSNSAARGRIACTFHKMVLCGSAKEAEL